MKLSRRELLAASMASVATRLPTSAGNSESNIQSGAAVQTTAARPHPPNLPVRDYLSREARRITDRELADVKTPEEFNRRLPERRRRFMSMMGLSELPPAAKRDPVPFKITGAFERSAYRVEKVHYESLPNLHVTANFYIPKGATASARRP